MTERKASTPRRSKFQKSRRQLLLRERHQKYHAELVKWCRILAAIHVDTELFEREAPPELAKLDDNMAIRWRVEDKIRELLRKNGDFPK